MRACVCVRVWVRVRVCVPRIRKRGLSRLVQLVLFPGNRLIPIVSTLYYLSSSSSSRVELPHTEGPNMFMLEYRSRTEGVTLLFGIAIPKEIRHTRWKSCMYHNE